MQVEDFYFSSAAGRARIVLGNRRWGENGYVASGRQQGRPVQRTPNNKVCNNPLNSLPGVLHAFVWFKLASQAGLFNRHPVNFRSDTATYTGQALSGAPPPRPRSAKCSTYSKLWLAVAQKGANNGPKCSFGLFYSGLRGGYFKRHPVMHFLDVHFVASIISSVFVVCTRLDLFAASGVLLKANLIRFAPRCSSVQYRSALGSL